MIRRLPIFSIVAIWGCLALISFMGAPPAPQVWAFNSSQPLLEPIQSVPLVGTLVDDLIHDAARRHNLDPALLYAIISVESDFNPRSLSVAGACGLTQLMPATAKLFNVRDIFDPKENIEAGAHHFRNLMEKYSNNIPLSLAAYNAGEVPVQRYRGIPPYPETQSYVRNVLLEYRRRSSQITKQAPLNRQYEQLAELER